jgi:tRNA A-37 threonylcarbamoyl transferase component Bud32
MEFLEGENLSHAIRRIAAATSPEQAEGDLELVSQVGEIYAKVHALDIALGDTKPENTMIGTDGKIYLIDFEQATRTGDKSGDKAWDLACFLYYCGIIAVEWGTEGGANYEGVHCWVLAWGGNVEFLNV